MLIGQVGKEKPVHGIVCQKIASFMKFSLLCYCGA